MCRVVRAEYSGDVGARPLLQRGAAVLCVRPGERGLFSVAFRGYGDSVAGAAYAGLNLCRHRAIPADFVFLGTVELCRAGGLPAGGWPRVRPVEYPACRVGR